MEKNNNNQLNTVFSYRRVIPLLYLLAVILMLFIVICNVALRQPKKASYGLGGFETMDTHWLTEDGTDFKISEIDKLRTDASDSISIYYELPETIANHNSIVFRSKNCLVKVMAGNDTLYETTVVSAPFYNHSPGTRWNTVGIDSKYAGQRIKLQVTQAYHDGRAKVDNFYYGDRAAIVLHLISSKSIGFVISLLIFFVGIIFLATWVVLNWGRRPKENGLLWLSAFAVIASVWCLLETNLFQLFTQNLQLIQVADNMMLVLGGLPLFLYLDSVFQVFRFRFIRILCAMDITYILTATLLQLLGLWDYHQTLNGAVATYGVIVIILIISLVRRHQKMKQLSTKPQHLFHFLQQLGILSLGLGLLVDLAAYLTVDVLDRAFFIRFGLLGFISFFGAGNIFQMIHLVQKGLQADFISQLAYQDGLTRVGNRTAYIEKLDELVKKTSKGSLGFVMFDINDLKWVNDNLGHKTGDDLISHCADFIEQSFGDKWTLYRIGGDEFVTLIDTANPREAYDKASRKLDMLVAGFNRTHEFPCPVNIARGCAFTEDISKENIEAVEREADVNMYKNKYELKNRSNSGS